MTDTQTKTVGTATYDKKTHRVRINIAPHEAQILLYALRCFCKQMAEAGDSAAKNYAGQMSRLYADIKEVL